jgi:hypothetical protein
MALRLKAEGQRVVCPLAELHLPAFRAAPGIRRETAYLKADDIGDVAAVEGLAGRQDLVIVGRGVTAKNQVFFLLPDDFVAGGHRSPVGAEPTDAQVEPVLHESSDRLFQRHDLVRKSPLLLAKESTRLVRIRVRKKWSFALCDYVEHKVPPLLAWSPGGSKSDFRHSSTNRMASSSEANRFAGSRRVPNSSVKRALSSRLVVKRATLE